MTNLKKYGVTIAEKHSFNDFGLIMTAKEISAPEPQIKTVAVPGRNGVIDLTEVLTGNVRYNPRTIKLSFYSDIEPLEWSSFISLLQNTFQGQRVKFIFDDDPAFYWIGRSSIELKQNGRKVFVELSASVDPYKYAITTSTEDWLWDPFDFEEGIINETANLTVDGSLITDIVAYKRWESPVIIASNPMQVKFNGVTYELKAGSQAMYEIILTEGVNTFEFIGDGTVTINYVGGML